MLQESVWLDPRMMTRQDEDESNLIREAISVFREEYPGAYDLFKDIMDIEVSYGQYGATAYIKRTDTGSVVYTAEF